LLRLRQQAARLHQQAAPAFCCTCTCALAGLFGRFCSLPAPAPAGRSCFLLHLHLHYCRLLVWPVLHLYCTCTSRLQPFFAGLASFAALRQQLLHARFLQVWKGCTCYSLFCCVLIAAACLFNPPTSCN
jgi:hypothetical protein